MSAATAKLAKRAHQALADAPDGLRKAELMSKAHLDEAAIQALVDAKAIRLNGKRGFGARFLKAA